MVQIGQSHWRLTNEACLFSLLTQIEPLVKHYGLPGLFVDVFLEALGLPLPGETLIIVAAGLAGLGKMNIYGVALAAFLAAVAGDNVGYLVGRLFGRPLIVRHGSRFGITQDRLAAVEELVRKRGPLIVAGARFFVVFRQLNGIAAGTVGMHWLVFLISNAVGAALWVGFWTTLAYHFGQDVPLLTELWKHLSVVALFLVVGALLSIGCAWLWIRTRKQP